MKKEDLEKIAQGFFKHLDPEAKVEVMDAKGWRVKVDSPNSGRLIGKMGETLKATQYLLRMMVAKTAGEYTPLTVDIGGYKEKHESELEEFALAVAENVKNSGYAQELRPMSPYDRRVIHAVLTNFEGVKTESVGEGELRRVKVLPEE
jgi:spoIIIJ-associated protein